MTHVTETTVVKKFVLSEFEARAIRKFLWEETPGNRVEESENSAVLINISNYIAQHI